MQLLLSSLAVSQSVRPRVSGGEKEWRLNQKASRSIEGSDWRADGQGGRR